MDRNFRIGPCRVLVADSIEANYAEWLDLGKTRGETVVSFQDNEIATGRSDQTGSAPLASAVYSKGSSQMATIQLVERSIETLLEVMPHAVKNTDNTLENLGFGSCPSFINPVAVCLMPVLCKDESVIDFWRSKYAHWFRNAYLELTGDFTSNLPEGDDALSDVAYEVTMNQVNSESGSQLGGIGSVFLLNPAISIMGVDSQGQLATAVPDADLRTALSTNGMDTVQQMAQNTGIFDAGQGTSTTPNTIADATGIEFLVRTVDIQLGYNAITNLPSLEDFTQLTNLKFDNNQLPATELDQLIDDLWKIRSELGANGCVIAIENNAEPPSQESINKIEGTLDTKYANDGLVDAGCTVTY